MNRIHQANIDQHESRILTPSLLPTNQIDYSLKTRIHLIKSSHLFRHNLKSTLNAGIQENLHHAIFIAPVETP